MPNVYYPYTKKDKYGKNVWELRRLTCVSCSNQFTTRNPNDVFYCSRKCKNRETVRRRRNGEKSNNTSK